MIMERPSHGVASVNVYPGETLRSRLFNIPVGGVGWYDHESDGWNNGLVVVLI